MEINYKTILQHLSFDCEKEEDVNNFPTEKNIMVSSDNFPKSISKLLVQNNKIFYRYGITKHNSEQVNISFITSFLTLLNKKFITFDKNEELSDVQSFISNIRSKVLEKGFKYEFKSRFEHQVLIDRLEKLYFDDGLLIQLIAQILDINFIIFDFKTEKISTIFKGDYLNPWKVTFLLGKMDIVTNVTCNWEPIFCDEKQFSYNDVFLKKILTNEEICYYNEEYLNKSYSILDNISEITNINNLSEDTQEDIIAESDDENVQSDESDTFLNPVNEIKKMNLTKTKLKSLKKDDIYKLINSLSLEVSKDVTKTDMITSLLPYI